MLLADVVVDVAHDGEESANSKTYCDTLYADDGTTRVGLHFVLDHGLASDEVGNVESFHAHVGDGEFVIGFV